MPKSSLSQLTGIWQCTIDTNVLGIDLKANNYYIFTNDKKTFNFSIDKDSEPRLYCFTLTNNNNSSIVLRYERELTDKYFGVDNSNIIYSDYYSKDLYDTISFSMPTTSELILSTKVLSIKNKYTKISNRDYTIPDTSVFRLIRAKCIEIDDLLKNKRFVSAKSDITNIYDVWLMKDEILFLFFMEDRNLLELVKKNEVDRIVELFNKSVSDGNNRLSKKYLYSLLYLNISEKEMLILQNKIKWEI